MTQSVRRLGDAHPQGRGQAHNGGVPGRQILGGDELHASHGDGGEHRDGGTAQHTLGDGGQNGGEFGGYPRQQQKPARQGKDLAIDHLVGGDDAHVLGEGGRGQSAHHRRGQVADAIGDDAALELFVSGLPAQAAHGGGGKVPDGLDGVDGKQQSNGDAGGQVKGDAKVQRLWQGEPGGAAHVRKAHHAKGQGHHIAKEHPQQQRHSVFDAHYIHP